MSVSSSLSSHISVNSHMFNLIMFFVQVKVKATIALQFVFLFFGPSRDSYVSVTSFFVVV